ncbi:MAG: hypothetical protein HFJ28_01870 [Clostridia bacterium]|jgi:hypothetical protein|nr:hypothetical protein [Clostridia bacterium]
MKKETNMKFHILAIICILLFSFSLTPVTFQNDTYYTISIGKHIVETKNVDMQDPFSWHEGLPYTYPHWAYDVGTYFVYELGENIGIGGYTSIYITTILLAMILGVILYYTMNKLCKNPLISFILTMIVMYLLKDFITARAQLVTYILFALTILFIEQFLKTKKKRYAVYLVIIPILIANLHCAVWPFYFVLYLPYVAEYLLAAINDSHLYYWFKTKMVNNKLKKLTQKGKIEEIGKQQEKLAQLQLQKQKAIQMAQKRKDNAYKVIFKKEKAAKWLIVIMLLSVLTGLLTPLGTVPYTYLAKTMEGNTVDNISEHQPLVLINNRAMLIVFIVYILLLIFTDTKASLRDFFMIGGLTLLAFMSRRQTSIFVIICGIIFAKLIASFIQKYDTNGTASVIKVMTGILGKVLTILVVVLLSFIMYKDKIGNSYVNEASYPVNASDYILSNIDIENMKLFNEYNYGSYLLYRGIPVFIDSRADLYAPEFNKTEEYPEGRDIFSDYINTSNIGTYYENKFEKYDITHVITGKKTKLNMFLSRDGNYQELYSDDYFVIYQRITNIDGPKG